jgi:hypothetical protein
MLHITRGRKEKCHHRPGIFAGPALFLLLLPPKPLYQARRKLLFFLVSLFSKAEKEEKGGIRGLKVRENQNFLEVT